MIKQPKIATLKVNYCEFPSGTMFSLGEKIEVAGITLYHCYTSILQKPENSADFIPKTVLKII
jgi:hypothetical protein